MQAEAVAEFVALEALLWCLIVMAVFSVGAYLGQGPRKARSALWHLSIFWQFVKLSRFCVNTDSFAGPGQKVPDRHINELGPTDRKDRSRGGV